MAGCASSSRIFSKKDKSHPHEEVVDFGTQTVRSNIFLRRIPWSTYMLPYRPFEYMIRRFFSPPYSDVSLQVETTARVELGEVAQQSDSADPRCSTTNQVAGNGRRSRPPGYSITLFSPIMVF
jgi:hypothetical protein